MNGFCKQQERKKHLPIYIIKQSKVYTPPKLTVIIGRAQNMLLEMLILSGMIAVSHPRGYREGGGQIVVQHRVGDGNGRATTVELEHLIRLVSLVGDQRLGPFRPDAGTGQQVDGGGRRPAQLALRLHRVGVAVAALAYVSGGQVDARAQLAHVARHVAQLEGGGREQFLLAGHGGVVDALGQAAPSQAAHAVDFDGDQGGERLAHAAVVGDHRQDVVVGSLIVQGLWKGNS